MAQRKKLQQILEDILESPNVYFQPPTNLKMDYPCIVYQRVGVEGKRADNLLYKKYQKYQITVIDRDPDSEIPMRVLELALCSYKSFFKYVNLNHDVFELYF